MRGVVDDRTNITFGQVGDKSNRNICGGKIVSKGVRSLGSKVAATTSQSTVGCRRAREVRRGRTNGFEDYLLITDTRATVGISKRDLSTSTLLALTSGLSLMHLLRCERKREHLFSAKLRQSLRILIGKRSVPRTPDEVVEVGWDAD